MVLSNGSRQHKYTQMNSLERPDQLKFPYPCSVEVSERKPGEAPTRRNGATAAKLITQPMEGINTVPDAIDFAARVHGTRPGWGWRDIVDVHEEEKVITKNVGGRQVKETKKWKYYQLSSYKYMDHIQVREAILEVASGMVELGIGKGEVFNIFAETSVSWQLMNYGCVYASVIVATAYDSLGESGLSHALREPDCVGLFTNAELLPLIVRVLPATPTIRVVVYDGSPKASVLDDIRNVREGIKLLSIDELRNLGRGKTLDPARYPKPADTLCIMYTSGTTGPPKGVVITHANLIASVGGVWTLLGHHLGHSDTFLAYLPLAHILEYLVELGLYFVGMTIGFARVKTLTDQSVRHCYGDIREFRPSIMIGVPAVWETIKKSILTVVNKSSSFRQMVFKGALAVKKRKIPILKQLADIVVFSQVKAQTGGKLRYALSGGAAISVETQEFLTLALVTVLQGYGMTESCGMCGILPPELMQYGPVGLPVPCIEMKLLDVPEAGYFSTNKLPQGEVLLRGPPVIKEYYKRPDLNNDETIFTKDGWFRTGDVGQWNADGTLSLIDRIKNLVKLQGGEYIALEQLETVYRSCNILENICVHASPDAKQPIAIAIPQESHLRHELAKAGLTSLQSDSLPDLCENEEVKGFVLKMLNGIGKSNGFKSLEMLQAIVLTPDEWTPESGLVTPAQKIQRKKVAEKFDKEIKDAYRSQG